MSNAVVLNEAKRMLMAGELALAGADIRAMLLMASTTALTENAGITRVSHYATLDEYDGTSYSRKALNSKAVSLNNTLNRAYFTSATIEFGAIAAGARDAVAVLIYKHVGALDSDNIPLIVVPLTEETPGDGTAFNVPCPSVGWWVHS